MAAAQSKGLTFQKTLEIRDPADIDALLLEEMNGATAGGALNLHLETTQSNPTFGMIISYLAIEATHLRPAINSSHSL